MNSRRDDEKRARARALYEEDVGDPPRSVRDVAGLIGLSPTRTYTLLVEAGTTLRPRGSKKKGAE